MPEFSVSDLAFTLKKTLEDNFGHVRVRGELSRVQIAGSGHMYSSLKDDNAVIDAVCWKGVLSRLDVKPEEGLEVIVTGKISSYPKSSKYQLIIESMELAGEGALLKMLEERKKKLAAEGLFAPERKQDIPFVPNVIGVVTSPTGAVIRDILHRLEDRFPRHVLVWPVLVQGDGAAQQISAAVRGFDAMEAGGAVPRPDLVIVARGGGSLEDLMAFNEEVVVRAVAECSIPTISAVGHETDTTLCDYAADLRAPTPTGAAEMAVPRRRDLWAQVQDDGGRMSISINRIMSEYGHRLEAQSRGLGDPRTLLEVKTQQLDRLCDQLSRVYNSYLSVKNARVKELSAALRRPDMRLHDAQKSFQYWSDRIDGQASKITKESDDKLRSLSKMLELLSFKSVLGRGFTLVQNTQGVPITHADDLQDGDAIQIQFKDDKMKEAVIGKNGTPGAPPKKSKSKSKAPNEDQTSLF